MINIHSNSVIQRFSGILSSEMDKETVMLSIESGEYFGLGETGSRVWQLIEKPVTFKVIIDILVAEYEVSRPECEKDVREFLEKLSDKNMIQIE